MKNAELRRIFATAAALVMAAGTTVTAFAEETADLTAASQSSAEKTEKSDYTGSFGKDVKWEYDPESKTLTVSGNGKMMSENGDENAKPFYKAHKWAAEVEKIVIGDGVESIADGAFEKFTSLKSVVIPESVKELGRGSFRNCISLEEIDLPSKITVIQNGAFRNCNELRNVTFPDDLKVIESEAFKGCCSLESIAIPYGTVIIGKQAFRNCLKLRKISLPETIDTYGEDVFDWTEDNEYLKIIADGANGRSYAYRNACLRFVVDGVECTETSGICGDSAYWSYDEDTGTYTITGTGDVYDVIFNSEWVADVKNVVIEEGITTVGHGFGCNFESLESISFPESFEGFEGFNNMRPNAELSSTALTSVDLPDKMTVIHCGMLEHCEKLKEVKLPAELKTIEEFAFLGCLSLESIVIPEKTEKIGEFAFDSCGLKTVTILSDNVDIVDSAFYLCPRSMVIRAHRGSTAEKYALDRDIKFEALEEEKTSEVTVEKALAAEADTTVQEDNAAAPADNAEEFVIGDGNGSGTVDISDISVLAIALVDGRELTDAQKKAFDVDGDGDVTLADLAKLRQYLSKKIEKL